MSKEKGKYICFNQSCETYGSLHSLIQKTTGKNRFEATRLILKNAGSQRPLAERLKSIEKVDYVEFSQATVSKMHDEFLVNDLAKDYMLKERGFELDTMKHFEVGYSSKKNLLAVPMHDPSGMPIGIVGRSVGALEKSFRNSKNLPKNKTLWNFHRAKKQGSTLIITEATFDAMRVHQAGYPNVVACLGSLFSSHHAHLVSRTFDTVVIMTDFDDKNRFRKVGCKKCYDSGVGNCIGHNPGRDLGAAISKALPGLKIKWAVFSKDEVYPHGAKDAGDMTDDEIRHCLRYAVSSYEYQRMNKY